MGKPLTLGGLGVEYGGVVTIKGRAVVVLARGLWCIIPREWGVMGGITVEQVAVGIGG